MASTRVRGGGATASSTTPQVTLAGAPTSGNLLVAHVKVISSETIAGANGFAVLTLGVSGAVSGRLLWKVSDGTETATVNPATASGSSAWGCYVSEWTNANGWPANPVNVENAQAVAATASYTTPTLSPAADVDNVIAGGYGCINASRTWSAEAFITSNVGAVTEEGDLVGSTMAIAAVSTVTGNYQGSATLSASTAGFDSIAIFKPNAAAPDQTVALFGLGTLERAGVQGLGYAVTAAGLSSAERSGVDVLGLTVAPLGAASGERVGVAPLGLGLAVAGLISAERFGPAQLGAVVPGLTIQAVGLESVERFGASAVTPGPVVLTLTGIASAEKPGVTSLAYLLALAGLGSEGRAGAASIGLALSLSGLSTAERAGLATIGLLISPSGVISVERLGLVQTVPGGVSVSLTGLGSSEAFGAVSLSNLVGLVIALTGLGSAERAGVSAVSPGLVTISPAGIPSSELFGPVASALNLTPTGIGSHERLGNAGLGLSVLATGLDSVERIGAVAAALGILLAGIDSAERIGAVSAVPGPVTVALVGLPSSAELGLVIVAGVAQYAILTVPLGGAAGASRRAGLIVVSRTGGLAGTSETDGLAGASRTGGLVGASRTDGEYP